MKNVLITGANKGIGLETARQLAKAGCFIFLGSRDQENGQTAVKQLHTEGLNNVELVVIDVTNEASVQQARNDIAKRITQLDVLINNAGIRGKIPQTPSTIADELVKAVFETNFFGMIRVTRIFMDLLKAAAQPRIVNVSSDLASLTLHNDPNWRYYPFKGAAYGPSKTALNAYTVALAFELKDTPFKVNAVNPGHTATDFNQHKGTQTVEQAAVKLVKYAMLGADGPTGKFISDDVETVW